VADSELYCSSTLTPKTAYILDLVLLNVLFATSCSLRSTAAAVIFAVNLATSVGVIGGESADSPDAEVATLWWRRFGFNRKLYIRNCSTRN
jgi:hypothetical protein